MPVYLDWLTDQPTTQQTSDLRKLLQDAPDAWNVPDCPEDYVAIMAGDVAATVALGIFNGRIVALCELQRSDQGLHIERILVREATRARTVATQLVHRLSQWADKEHATLLIRDEGERLNQLLAFGFQKHGDLWIRRN